MQEALEAELAESLAPHATLVQAFCGSRGLLRASSTTQAAALMALLKLMAVSRATCEANLQLVFTLVAQRCAPCWPLPRCSCSDTGHLWLQ